MALRYLLDTNICIYIAKQRPPAVAKRFARLHAAGTVEEEFLGGIERLVGLLT